MSLTERAADFLPRMLKRGAGVAVTYTRGVTSASLTAWVGRTLFSRLGKEPGAAAVEWGDRDYLIETSDLDAAGFHPPRKGDRITETINDGLVIYEAATPTGEPSWRYADPGLTLVRIHVKRVG